MNYLYLEHFFKVPKVFEPLELLRIGLLTRRPRFDSHQSHGNFQSYLLRFVLCYGFHVVRLGLSLGLDLTLRRNGLILHGNGFQVIINDDLFEEGEYYSTLHIAYRFISYR